MDWRRQEKRLNRLHGLRCWKEGSSCPRNSFKHVTVQVHAVVQVRNTQPTPRYLNSWPLAGGGIGWGYGRCNLSEVCHCPRTWRACSLTPVCFLCLVTSHCPVPADTPSACCWPLCPATLVSALCKLEQILLLEVAFDQGVSWQQQKSDYSWALHSRERKLSFHENRSVRVVQVLPCAT